MVLGELTHANRPGSWSGLWFLGEVLGGALGSWKMRIVTFEWAMRTHRDRSFHAS